MTTETVQHSHPNGMECPLCNPYCVGSVWYTSWGYDQTNVEYYTVVRETAASVWVVPMSATVRDGRLYPGTPVLWTMGPSDSPHVASAEMHRKPRDRALSGERSTTAYLHLDSVRNAWPYTGGGRYDTLAAGEAGH